MWRAVNAAGQVVALKVLHAVKAQREPYRRFVREIEVLRTLSDTSGILPLIGAYLPDKPCEADRPWLAMPIATPILEAVAGESLEGVVEGVSNIAQTLNRLHNEYGLAHRDVKPGNLYSLGGEWLVGDLGLVAVPDIEELTRSGRPLGPAHYTPYEMMVNPVTADPKPVDVYMLAKTLWVLATEQRFPPEGHQRADTRGFSVLDFRTHPNAHLLDSLIDRSTRFHPKDRPTMAEVAADLTGWLALPPETKLVDVGDLRARLRAKMQVRMTQEDQAAERRALALQAVRRLAALVSPLNQALRDLHPRAEIDVSADKFMRNVVRTLDETSGSPDIVFRYQRLSRITVGNRPMGYQLRFGRTVELTDDGSLTLHMFIDVGYETLNGQAFMWMPEPWSAHVGTVESEEDMRVAVRQAAEQLLQAAEVFVDGVTDEGT